MGDDPGAVNALPLAPHRLQKGEDPPMPRTRSIRTAVLAILLLGLAASLAAPVAADTSTTTGGSVTITDAGTLDIHWQGEGATFLANGESPSVTAVDGATVTATFTLVIDDTRAAESRPGYEVRLSADPFTITGTDHLIPAAQLSITDITGLPDGLDASAALGLPLDAAVTLLTVPAGADPVNATLAVTITMTIPAGTFPGTFGGAIDAEIVLLPPV
jgi:hypothetical protein